MSIEIIAPVSAVSKRTRLYKLGKFLLEKKCKIKHVGWERIAGESAENYFNEGEIEKKLLVRGGGYGGTKTRLLYFVWMFKVFFYCLSLKSNKTVWALGFESAFPALLASKLKGFKIVFDDADRFSMLFPLPSPVKRVIESLEKWTSRRVDTHVIPSQSRYDFNSTKFFELKNTPNQGELAIAQQLYKDRKWPTAKVVVNVNGWLGKDRGMSAALAIASHFNKEDLHIVLAGKIDCDEAKQLSTLDNVTYLGNLSNSEALASYYCCDFVLTYYDPKYKINTLAESNKWGDAQCCNINIIVNSEVLSAKQLLEDNRNISVPYHDHHALIEQLSMKIRAKEIHPNDSVNTSPPMMFEQQLTALFKKIEYTF